MTELIKKLEEKFQACFDAYTGMADKNADYYLLVGKADGFGEAVDLIRAMSVVASQETVPIDFLKNLLRCFLPIANPEAEFIEEYALEQIVDSFLRENLNAAAGDNPCSSASTEDNKRLTN